MMRVHDVFIVHAAADAPFVDGYLLAKLGLAGDRVVRLQTLELGEDIVEQVELGVQSSRVTIVVLSSAYMGDRWARFGERLAACAAVAEGAQGVLLPLLLEDCHLALHLQSVVPLDFRDPAREVWDVQIARLRAYLEHPAPVVPDLPCPYPGMRPFTEHETDWFFGREAELEDIVYRLRHGEREIYVIGASGSGKSSLIAAGLIPRLTRGLDERRFHVCSFRPGERPVERLAAALECDTVTPRAVEQLLDRHAPDRGLLLVIDQLEEVFAIAGDDARREFCSAVRQLRDDGRCTMVFTLRADFYGAFLNSSLWADNEGRISRIDLGPLSRDNLRRVIERPALTHGVYVQPALTSRLLDDAGREPGALPLLQECLVQLWSRRRQRLLAVADYQSLSRGARIGLAFAIEQHADFVVGQLTSIQRAIAFRILTRLVAFGEGRADTRRQQPRDALRSAGEAAASFDAVLRYLVDRRLLTVSRDSDDGDVRVDLAHEVLIDVWSALLDWLRTWRSHEQRRREIESAAAAWRARGSGDGGLLDELELAGAVAWRQHAAQQLGCTADMDAFLVASEAAQDRAARLRNRNHRLAFIGIALFTLIASVLALAALRNAREAAKERDRSRMLLATSAQVYLDLGRQTLAAGHSLQALRYAVEARAAIEASGGTADFSLHSLFEDATRSLPALPPLEHQHSVMSAAFSPDGCCIVTASYDKTARVWDASTGHALSSPLIHDGWVWTAVFSPDGKWIVTTSSDNAVRVWDAVTGQSRASPLRPRCRATGAEFGPDRDRVVITCDDATLQTWDPWTGTLRSSERLSPPLQHLGAGRIVAYGLRGKRVLTVSDQNLAEIWDAATGRQISPPVRPPGVVTHAAFSPDGTLVVTVSTGATVVVWDTRTGKAARRPLQHDDAVMSVAFSPDSTRVVTASLDATARVWSSMSDDPPDPNGTLDAWRALVDRMSPYQLVHGKLSLRNGADHRASSRDPEPPWNSPVDN